MQVGATVSISGLVVFGTFTSLAAKIVYELDGIGIDGKLKNFEKPWAMTTVMFVGMTFCLPLAYYYEHRAKQQQLEDQQNESTEPLLNSNGLQSLPSPPHTGGNTWKEVFMLAIPTFFDLIATILMNVGLLYVTASVYQMLRGAEMLFAALFAVVFLKRKLNKYHFGGIACCITGITLVGVSSLMSGEGSSSHHVPTSKILFGMALIVMSQAVQAAQITFEDFFMADLAIPPLKIVGYEGLFGALTMLLFLLPLVQRMPGIDGQGIHEDSIDTWHMIMHSSNIFWLLLFDMAALLAYNVSGMMVTGHLGAVFRTVLETTRTLFVWLIDLVLFYTPLGLGKLGEKWTVFSYVQAAGFLILVAGTVIYGKGDEEEIAQEIAEGGYDAGLETGNNSSGVDYAGPLPIRSGMTMPMAVSMASSLKSSMNMNAFGSMSNSVSNSLRHRGLLSPPRR